MQARILSFQNTRGLLVSLAIPIALAGPVALAHGGDSHDLTPVHLLRGKILVDHQDEHGHEHSRFSLGITANSSQHLGDVRPRPSLTPSNLSENRLSAALNYRVSDAATLNLLTAFSSTEAMQDPSLGSTFVRAIGDHGLQSILFAAIAAPVSKISREQNRLITLNLSSGVFTTVGRWTAGAFGNLGLPFYDGARRSKPIESEPDEDTSLHKEDSHEDGHAHTAERFLAGGSLKLGYRLGQTFRLDSSVESIAKRLMTNITVFDSELTLAKLCYLGAGWEAGIGMGWKEENGSSLHFPTSMISKFNLTIWR